ncbi:MAG: DUF2142 domain-containing protein [Lachnospiraceae bacterium]|nr:DUF2142 domain-containing protein [Lachnospiraceae bacterium]
MGKQLKRTSYYRKNVIISICILLILVAVLGSMYCNEIKPIAEQRMKYVKSRTKGEVFELESGRKLSQKVTMESDSFERIGIMYDEFQGQESSILKVEISNEEGKTVQSWELELTDQVIDKKAEGVKILYFNTNETVHVEDQGRYTFNVELIGGVGDYFKFYSTDSLRDRAVIDGIESKQSLAIEVLGGTAGGIRYFFLGIAVLTVFGMGIVLILLIRREPVEKIFVGTALIFGLIYMLVIPPYAVPDEQAHFMTAYNNSSEILGEETVKDGNRAVLQEKEILCDPSGYYPTKERYIESMNGLLGRTYENNGEAVIGGTILDMPKIAYVPQTLGITLARILNFNGIQLFYMGRIFALLTYIVITYWAIRIMPFAKMVLVVTALLPMSMQQAMSYSYDVLVNAFTFLMLAYFFYLIYKKDKVETKDIIILSVCTAIIAPIKVVYIVIIGMGILIPYQKFGTKAKKWACAFTLVLAGAIPTVITRIVSMLDMLSGNQGSSDLLGYEVYGGVYFFKHLGELLDIFIETAQEMTSYYVDTMIGKQLGWLEIEIPHIIIEGFLVLLLISAARKCGEKVMIKTGSKVWMGTLAGVCCILTCFVLLISWTEVGEQVIAGVQGRYFLPIAPMIVLLFRTKYIMVDDKFDRVIIMSAVVLEIATVLSVLRIVLPR